MRSKLICLIFMFLILSSQSFGQDQRVNTHGYSVVDMVEDSSTTTTWRLGGVASGASLADVDTSIVYDISKYTELASFVSFGWAAGTAHADSLEVSIYADISFDKTSWIVVDSIHGASPLSVATITAICPDTCYYWHWGHATTFGPAAGDITARYFRVRMAAYAATISGKGIDVTISLLRQQ